MRRRTLCFFVGLTLLALVACSSSPSTDSGRLRVVASFYPLEEVARRVGGELVGVTDLTPAGAEPHDIELRPSDIQVIRSAGVILYFAGGFQPAVEGAIDASGNKSRAIDLLEAVPVQTPPPGSEKGLSADPHVWLSPPLMKEIVARVSAVLAERLPAHRAQIDVNAAQMSGDLDALDTEFRTGLAACKRHDIFTSHAAFGYLAARYGLRQIAITGLSPEAEPSSKRLQQVAALARTSGATTIFFESLVSPRVSQSVARIVGARTAVLDPIEGISGKDQAAGRNYFTVMRDNLRALQGALGCST